MSKMSDMWVSIEELLRTGMVEFMIAERLHVPIEWVYSVAEEMQES